MQKWSVNSVDLLLENQDENSQGTFAHVPDRETLRKEKKGISFPSQSIVKAANF